MPGSGGSGGGLVNINSPARLFPRWFLRENTKSGRFIPCWWSQSRALLIGNSEMEMERENPDYPTAPSASLPSRLGTWGQEGLFVKA